MRFTSMTRDWKGTHGDKSAKGWTVFAVEEEIDTSGDDQAIILTDDYKAAVSTGFSGQDVYDLIEQMRNEDVDGWKDVKGSNGDTIEQV